MNFNIDPWYLVVMIVSILVSLTIHEFMHAWVGFKLGDSTAHDEGRISLNPLRHIDPLMTVALPIATLIFFGAPILAAKPVPFTPWRLNGGDKGAALLAAAGPLSNLVLAAVAALALQAIDPTSAAHSVLVLFASLNVSLFVFNMMPIPPLDGSRVLYAFAPESVRDVLDRLEQFGLILVFAIILLGGFRFISVINQAILRLLGIF